MSPVSAGGPGSGPPARQSSPNPIFAWILDAARALETIGAGNPRLEAEYLMAHALGIARIRLWILEDAPSAEELARFEALLARRLVREPLQYVLGTAEFAGLTLEVGPGVFIPRSETEVLVEIAADRIAAQRAGTATVRGAVSPGDAGDVGELSGISPRIVDVCTGSGAILLALLSRLPGVIGTGIDRSADALGYARRNAVRTGLDARARWVQGDLLDPLGDAIGFDAIVSNPPYIRSDEAVDLAPEIRDHEPHAALFSGEDGLDAVRRLIPQAAFRLRPAGLLAMEIGITQAEAVLGLLDARTWMHAEVFPDLTGRPRVAVAVRR